MNETAEARLKRLSMRSWRRGTKEMDLILGPFADAHLSAMSDPDLATYDRLLAENDQDLITWVMGTAPAPDWAQPLIARVATHARAGLTKV